MIDLTAWREGEDRWSLVVSLSLRERFPNFVKPRWVKFAGKISWQNPGKKRAAQNKLDRHTGRERESSEDLLRAPLKSLSDKYIHLRKLFEARGKIY